MDRSTRIAPCLWFDGKAEEAATFYAETFPDSSVERVNRGTGDWPGGKAGDAILVEFTLFGQSYVGLNGGPGVTHSEAMSIQVYTDSQDETDRYWNAITGNGGNEIMCSWCEDRWGVRWQIVPRVLMEALSNPDREAAKRANEAMLQMTKIDIATIEAALRG